MSAISSLTNPASSVAPSAMAADAGVDMNDKAARTAWLNSNEEARFYASKGDDLRYFCHQFLPRTAAFELMIGSDDSSVLDCVF